MLKNIKRYLSDLNGDIILNKQKIRLYWILYCLIPGIFSEPIAWVFGISHPYLGLKTVLTGWLTEVLIINLLIIFFIPTYLVLYSLFKKFKNKWHRCMLVSVAIPLTVFFCFLIILPFPNIIRRVLCIFLCITGIGWLVYLLPISFVITILTPKKLLNEKYYNLLAIFIMEITGILLYFITIITGGCLGIIPD